jgi:hypothetical protein
MPRHLQLIPASLWLAFAGATASALDRDARHAEAETLDARAQRVCGFGIGQRTDPHAMHGATGDRDRFDVDLVYSGAPRVGERAFGVRTLAESGELQVDAGRKAEG